MEMTIKRESSLFSEGVENNRPPNKLIDSHSVQYEKAKRLID